MQAEPRSDFVDQAAGLRSLMTRQSPRMVTVIESGQAAGPQRIASGLASALARQRRRVLFLDESAPDKLMDVVAARRTQLAVAQEQRFRSLGEIQAASADATQFVVLDAQVNDDGLSDLAASAHEILIAVEGEDVSGGSLTAAYACIKNLHARHRLLNFCILPVACSAEARAYGVFCRLATVASRYLTVKLTFAGYLPGPGSTAVAMENAYMALARGLLVRAR